MRVQMRSKVIVGVSSLVIGFLGGDFVFIILLKRFSNLILAKQEYTHLSFLTYHSCVTSGKILQFPVIILLPIL